MLDTITLLRAMNGIHDADVFRAGNIYFDQKRATSLRRKRILTFALAAAMLLALGTAAYAIGLSIHQRRQAELRESLRIDENAVSGYTEYTEESGESPQPAGAARRPSIQPVSSIQQGNYQLIYFSVSPVTEEEARSFIFGNLETGFVIIAGNEEIPEEAWHDWDLTDLSIARSYANAVFYDDGHAEEHKIEVSSQTGLPDENGEQGTVTFEVIDPAWSRPLILEHSYDAESQSLLMQTGVYRKHVDFSRPVYFSVRCLDLQSMIVTDEEIEEQGLNYAPVAYEVGKPVYLHDYGTVVLEASDTEFLALELGSPIQCVNAENGESCEILSVRLSANSVEWKLTHDGIDQIFSALYGDGQAALDSYEKELQWFRFYDDIVSGSYLTFADGSTFAMSGSHSIPYENGILTLYSEWDGTIDIRAVRSITFQGTTYEFPQINFYTRLP